jgi:lipopolysaccharide/colanic/teichoic acid biosynthesis glycosyltransferase
MIQTVNLDGQHKVIVSDVRSRDKNFYFACKRCIDVAMAATLLCLLLPLMPLIALLIKLDSRGPILFVQERVGTKRRSRDGQIVWETCIFPFYKFRSMYQNADQSLHKAYIRAFVEGGADLTNQSQQQFKLANDPRVTRVGRILRKTSLDELPQLINVLKGDMSLVGPRPVPTYEVAKYQAKHYERLAAPPGITGLWQVKGRGQVTFEEMVRLDIEYVCNQSLWLDAKILFLTIPAVLSRRGAE